MSKSSKDQRWVFGENIDPQPIEKGVQRKVLAYCDVLMCVENTFEIGAEGKLHNHPHSQITYVSEGKFKFTIGDETHIVKKGDALLKRDGVVHGCVCLEKGVLVDFFNPMREDFV
jgi:quercetin dioxygenase-like cupin family protein